MSVTDHSIADFTARGRTYHADRYGTVHDGPVSLCESCRLARFRALRAHLAATAVLPCDRRSEDDTLRDVNALLDPEPKRFDAAFAVCFAIISLLCIALWFFAGVGLYAWLH